MNAAKYSNDAVTGNLSAVLMDRFYRRVFDLYKRSFSGLVSKPTYITRMSHDALDMRRSREQVASIERTHGISLAGKRVLEVGAGLGLTVAVARLEFGAESFGIEPSAEEYDGSLQIARDLLTTCGLPPDAIVSGVGENLPFESASFDAVISSNVLEHVRDPAAVIRESIRVLRPGGILHFVVPNYGSWWEGHYGVLWLPHMPRWAARWYVRMLGRDPAFLDTLQFIHYGWLARIVRQHRDQVDVLGYGAELWEQRVRTLDFAEYHTLHKVKAILRVLHRMGLITLVLKLGRALHWETPLVLVLRKR